MLDIRGGLKNTKMSRHPLAVLEELASNSIDSFLIRQNRSVAALDFQLSINVEITQTDLHGETLDLVLEVSDNGAGYDEPAIQAFVTKDTSYKDDLKIAGIEQCKGSGRIQYFHVFERIEIDSVAASADSKDQVKMSFAKGQKTITREHFVRERISDELDADILTKISLSELRPLAREKFAEFGDLSEIFSAESIKSFLLSTFLQRLIGLSAKLGDFEVRISTSDRGKQTKTAFGKSDLPTLTSQRSFTVQEQDPATGEELESKCDFELTHYRIAAEDILLSKNAISLCAKSTPVEDITSRYLRTKTQENNDLDGSYHIIFVESRELDKRVNEERDGFDDLPETIPSGDLFSKSKISRASIFEALDDIIEELVAPPDWDRDEVKASATQNFGISDEMLTATGTRIRYGDNARSVAKRVLQKYQDKIIKETAEIVDLYQDVALLAPDAPDFREKINKLSWSYTASIKSFDMANLSQLVVRRTAIVRALDLARRRLLICQNVTADERRKDERLIHHIFFPMQKSSDSDDIEHDIWLLSEEFQYYDYIVSDRPLSAIELPGGQPFFDPDIDDELAKILASRADENKSKRPDIALFTEEGAAVIVEFKAPKVSMDNHVGDLSEYAHLLAAKSGGRLRRFYAYLIGDTLNPLRLTGWTPFSDDRGYFQTTDLRDPQTRSDLGEMYSEILYYDDIVDRANKRIQVYQEKLGLLEKA